MSHRVLLTGASGYLGGTLLSRWSSFGLPRHDGLYALVRTAEQACAVKQYAAEPLNFDIRNEKAVFENVVNNKITVVLFLVDAAKAESQVYFIKALAEVKNALGIDVHFLHTSGAKLFSSHAGAPFERPLLDTDPGLYEIQKSQSPLLPALQPAIDANNIVIEQGEMLGVRAYIFVPCIVYGKGQGFGNILSIQTVAIVKAALEAGRVYDVNAEESIWPVCDVIDNTNLYLHLVRSMLAGEGPGHGKQGYYLAASGSIKWAHLYSAIAAALAEYGAIQDVTVLRADDRARKRMATGLGCPEDFVSLQLGGTCSLTARRCEKIGWKPERRPSHILETAAEEVKLILAMLKAQED